MNEELFSTILIPFCGYGFTSSVQSDGTYAYPVPTAFPSPAARAGLQPGDRLESYRLQNGEWSDDFTHFPSGQYGIPVELRINRPETHEILTLTMTSERVAMLATLPQFLPPSVSRFLIPATPEDCPALSHVPNVLPVQSSGIKL